MSLKLYAKLTSSPCRSVITVAKALELELDIIEVDDDFMQGPDILELNPQHTIPILQDEDFTIWESHAIMAYLVNKFSESDELYPKEPRQRAIVDQRMHFESGVLQPRFVEVLFPSLSGVSAEITEKKFERLDDAFGFLNEFLNDNEWLTGNNVTIADIGILCILSAIEFAIPIDEEKFPRLHEWLQRGKEITYFKEANEFALEKTEEFIKEKIGL